MGEPKFSRKKYERPKNPWEAVRIKEENEFLKKYGLKNKQELWRAEFLLRNFRRQSRDLQARLRVADIQARKETESLLIRLKSLSMLNENATLDDVLTMNVEIILNRRLQTIVYLKGLATTPNHARQLITHGHTSVQGRKVTIPGYLVKQSEESTIIYNPSSPLSNDLHPARPKKEEFGVQPTAPVPPPAPTAQDTTPAQPVEPPVEKPDTATPSQPQVVKEKGE